MLLVEIVTMFFSSNDNAWNGQCWTKTSLIIDYDTWSLRSLFLEMHNSYATFDKLVWSESHSELLDSFSEEREVWATNLGLNAQNYRSNRELKLSSKTNQQPDFNRKEESRFHYFSFHEICFGFHLYINQGTLFSLFAGSKH